MACASASDDRRWKSTNAPSALAGGLALQRAVDPGAAKPHLPVVRDQEIELLLPERASRWPTGAERMVCRTAESLSLRLTIGNASWARELVPKRRGRCGVELADGRRQGLAAGPGSSRATARALLSSGRASSRGAVSGGRAGRFDRTGAHVIALVMAQMRRDRGVSDAQGVGVSRVAWGNVTNRGLLRVLRIACANQRVVFDGPIVQMTGGQGRHGFIRGGRLGRTTASHQTSESEK